MRIPETEAEREEHFPRLRAVKLFESLSDDAVREIAAQAEWVYLEAAALLFEAGAPADALFVVVEGRLEAWTAEHGREHHVGRISAGESVGETSLRRRERRQFTVRAARDTLLLRLKPSVFEALATRHVGLSLGLNQVLIGRMLRSRARPTREATAFAVVPASSNAPLEAVAAQLHKALASWRTAHLVSAATIDSALGSGAATADVSDARHDAVSRHLAKLEGETSLLVLVADRDDSEWTRRCIRHADTVLLVANAQDRPGAYRLSGRLAGADQGEFDRRELVLVHPDGTSLPSQTRLWLDRIPADAWHHVRLGFPGDLERVARFVTGRAIGVAMAGGGARGYIHVGVLRALREAEIPVDLLCGTSMGAVISALAAVGLDDRKLGELIKRHLVDRNPLDYTIPLVSILRGNRFGELVLGQVGDMRVEDTWLRYFSVSSSLTRCEAVVHRTGMLAQAVRASGALPGLFPPVIEDDDVQVDGAFLDNMPAERALEQGAGKVIAVNTLPPVGALELGKFREMGPLDHIAQILGPRSQNRFPPVAQLGMHAQFLPATNEARRVRDIADIFIEPDVSKFFFMAFRTYEPIAQMGYVEAKRVIAAKLANDPTFATR
jgi:predicted acylesterase/phospholipase RssA/CRP-like cAMP-binding protein